MELRLCISMSKVESYSKLIQQPKQRHTFIQLLSQVQSISWFQTPWAHFPRNESNHFARSYPSTVSVQYDERETPYSVPRATKKGP